MYMYRYTLHRRNGGFHYSSKVFRCCHVLCLAYCDYFTQLCDENALGSRGSCLILSAIKSGVIYVFTLA